jgi:ribokinase
MRVKRIVVVGSANTDMILKCEHLPKPGETILGGQFAIAAGGKGANQAVAAARLGGEVTFVARLGRDWMGDQALANYRAEGINCACITRDDHAASGVALIMVDRAAENLIGVAPGANGALTPEHVAQAEQVIRDAAVLVVQLEIPLETVAAAIRLARKHAVRVILNPAPARALPAEMLQDVIVTPNETEAAILTEQQVTTPSGIENAARQLLALGARAVVMTLGERGALWATRTQMRIVPAFRVQPVDTTAAGDAFNGGLAVALSCGTEPVTATRYACAVGALTVTRLGAQPSLPTKRELDAFLRTI